MDRPKNILICPLEWGLGHAGRMIPLARKLRERNNNVFIGSGKEIQEFFQNELTGLNYIDFEGFRPSYSGILPQYLHLLFKIPVLIYSIISEHIKLNRIIRENKIDIVISDNRFGLWNRNVKSVYVTHQILIPFPPKLKFLEWTGIFLHRFIIRKYDLCLIPDLPGETNLSGRLSHSVKIPSNCRFTGLLSRFTDSKSDKDETGFSHNTLILSGPEPQRAIFRESVIKNNRDPDVPLVVLEGRPGTGTKTSGSDNVISFSHLQTVEMKRMLTTSKGIVTRAGYSSVMELISLGCSALLVPTPGQPEQEYLADYLSGKGWFTSVTQKGIADGVCFPVNRSSWPEDMLNVSKELLRKALDELLDQ